MNRENLIKKFKHVPIGRDNLDKDIFIDRILKEDGLKHFLYNIYAPKDESLTKEGLNFLKEYYGLEKIEDIILKEKRDGVDYHFNSKGDVIAWLKGMVRSKEKRGE